MKPPLTVKQHNKVTRRAHIKQATDSPLALKGYFVPEEQREAKVNYDERRPAVATNKHEVVWLYVACNKTYDHLHVTRRTAK
jgi:hypothetical protein